MPGIGHRLPQASAGVERERERNKVLAIRVRLGLCEPWPPQARFCKECRMGPQPGHLSALHCGDRAQWFPQRPSGPRSQTYALVLKKKFPDPWELSEMTSDERSSPLRPVWWEPHQREPAPLFLGPSGSG